MPTKPAFLTVTRAAQDLQTSRKTVYQWLKKGRLTLHTVPGTASQFVVNDEKMSKARNGLGTLGGPLTRKDP